LKESQVSLNDRFHELAMLTKILKEREGEQAEKTKHVRETEERVKKLSTELASMTAAFKVTNEEKAGLTRQLGQMVAGLQAKDIAIQAQRQRAVKLKQTVSWKITAPVRALARPFRQWSKKTDPIQEQVELIKQSSLFDESWYLEQYPDVMEDGGDAALHYLQHGASEGRNPSPNFNTNWYLETYMDVAESGRNPLVQYIKYGEQEGHKPNAE
jgi:hypothetical protein